MCDICGKTYCPTGCPGRAEAYALRCVWCGRVLGREERIYEGSGNPYCRECVEEADLDQLVRICGLDKRLLLSQIGIDVRKEGRED